MRSVRFRIALIAALATALAVTAVSYFLVSQVRSSLIAEIDDSITDQLFDYEGAIFVTDDILLARIPGDAETLFVVVNSQGVIFDFNDDGVDGVEVVEAMGVADAIIGINDYVVVDVSLPSATQTPGSESMRAVSAQLVNLEEGEPLYAVFARVTAGADRTVAGMRNALLVAIPLLVAFVAALAWWLAGRSLKPVDVMRREVDEISLTDLGRRLSEPQSRDEIGQLATTMNRMLSRLEASQRSQEQFVSDAAHELRTPLASIAAQLDVDRAHPASADREATATNVRSEVSRLQALIDGLLTSARNQDGTAVVSQTLVDVDVVAIESVARVNRPSSIAVDQRAIGAGVVRGDETALTSLVDNLLSNAYRHARSVVSIGVGSDAAGVWLTVDDDGDGVPESERQRIFDRLVRLDEARAKDAGGSGLGLALARETAVRHGGTLEASQSELGGARFVLRLAEAR